MTCLRSLCERKATVGVHCVKCRKRFLTRRHNARHFNRESGFDSLGWPCYSGTNFTGWTDALVGALEPTQ